MKKKITKLFAGVALGVMLLTGSAQAAAYQNGYYSIDCSLNCYSRYAKASTGGASCYSNGSFVAYNRVYVCTRNQNGTVLRSALAVKETTATAKTGRSSNVYRANSYHFVSDRNGNSVSPLYQQVVLTKYK